MSRSKRIAVLALVLMTVVGVAHAEVDVPWQWAQQKEIEKAYGRILQNLSPFSAENGFPEQRPAGLEGKSWEETYAAAAGVSGECEKIMADLIAKNTFPPRINLGAQYFRLRLAMGARSFPRFAGNERAHEFFCRDFARECQEGLLEFMTWKSPEPLMPFDNLWAPAIREGLPSIRNLLPVLPDVIPADQAQNIWREAAGQAIQAANEAGMASARIGYFDFPSWRLRYAVKYFKAKLKESVMDLWDQPRNANVDWGNACERLRACVNSIPAEMEEILALLPQ